MSNVDHTAENGKSGQTELRPGSILDLQSRVFHSPTTSDGRHLLHILLYHRNAETGKCNPSQALLAKEMNCSERHIRKILTKDLPHLVTTKQTQHSLKYTLHLPENPPPMLVSSPAPGEFPVTHVADSHPEQACRSDRNRRAGPTGTGVPTNIERTEKEHSFVEDQQKTFSPKKGTDIKPTLKAVQVAFEKRGLPSGQAKTEAKRFRDYNKEKNWRMNWEQGVERWQPKEPGQQTVESRPVLPLYKPPEVEEHTPEQRERNLAVLKGVQQPLTARAEPKTRQVGKILTAKEKREAATEEAQDAAVRQWQEEEQAKAGRKTA